MLLQEIVTASVELAATRSRKKKAEILAALLGASGPDIGIAVGFLIGAPRQGRIGVGYAGAFTVEAHPAAEPSLTLARVDQALTDLAAIAGPGAQARRTETLEALFGKATEGEQDFLRRVLTGEVRHGALEGLLIHGIVQATGVEESVLRRALMLSGDLAETAELAFSGGEDGLAAIELQVMRPVLPMLAHAAKEVAAALAITGVASVEWKLDGLRLQAHRQGGEIAIFTRARNEITHRLPEVVRAVAALPVHSIILDGEGISLRPDGRPAPFEETMSRASSDGPAADVPVLPFFFDVLHVDGHSWIDRPLNERLAELDRLVPEGCRIPRVITDVPEEAEAFLARALEQGHEGILVKGVDTIYEAGRRGAHWVKVKPAHTLDLVVLAAEWGSGRRSGWLSNLHLGARDPGTGGFIMLGKTFKGLTDATLEWQTKRLQELEVRRTRSTVFVDPVLVVEIAFDGIQPSSRYPGGMALRFARVKGYRSDKAAAEADTIDAVRAIFAARG